MEKVIGIDLGTTYSCVAFVEGDKPVVIPNKNGEKITPSVIAFQEGGKWIVGSLAKRQSIINSRNTIFCVKRIIGRDYESPEVEETKKRYNFEMVKGELGDARIKIQNRIYTIPELSAMVLMEMKKVAEEHLGTKVTKAVVTVPAYFNDNQRQATKDAATIAGLEVLKIINEPTASSIAFGYGKNMTKKIAVYDFGGGTFDLSIIDINEGVFEVLASAGNTFLGGEDIDFRIVDYLNKEFMMEHGIDLREDPMALQRLKDAAETAKCELSFKEEVQINLPFLITRDGKTYHFSRNLTRQELESLISDIVNKTIEICSDALTSSKLSKYDIDDILLVGGQTRTPLVQKAVEEYFGKPPNKGVPPDEVVAMGAAIHASSLMKETLDMLLLDVTPHSLGIMTAGGYTSVLIPRNTTIPTQKSHVFTTVNDNQTTVKIVVLQGESKIAKENQLLGEFMLTGLKKMPKGVPEIDVTFTIDSNGIVNVLARDRDTGRKHSIEVKCKSLPEEELKKMIKEYEEYEIREAKKSKIDEARDRMVSLFTELKTLYENVKNSLPSGEKKMIEKAFEAYASIETTEDENRIYTLSEEFEKRIVNLRQFISNGTIGDIKTIDNKE